LGEYLIWPIKDGFSVLKNGQEIDKIRFPKGGRAVNIVVSPTGHIAANVTFTEEGRRTAAYLYRLGGVTPPTDSPFPPSGPTEPPSGIIPGQLLEITYPSATSTNPNILIRFATLNSVTQGNMNLSIYDQPYSVNTQNAQFYRFNYAPAALSEFVPGSFVNIFGTLDIDTGTSINASVVRNPLPAGAAPTGGAPTTPFPDNATGANTVPAPTTPAPTTAATQNTLNSLEQLLLNLQQRFAQ
jgi:hypothetical protein